MSWWLGVRDAIPAVPAEVGGHRLVAAGRCYALDVGARARVDRRLGDVLVPGALVRRGRAVEDPLKPGRMGHPPICGGSAAAAAEGATIPKASNEIKPPSARPTTGVRQGRMT